MTHLEHTVHRIARVQRGPKVQDRCKNVGRRDVLTIGRYVGADLWQLSALILRIVSNISTFRIVIFERESLRLYVYKKNMYFSDILLCRRCERTFTLCCGHIEESLYFFI